ncbi:hypothetical protein DERP_005343 [Dermatophagoides pteronyssinus]|uniref:Uncharacterized protein n=1 Tax=Dermatophagoides pteronyssinus TaxID=6956 RepID=A0ABQ8JMV7_DERPT|nr:hypothetical protein DERP_005343 [Dermatophagoides pteronyssinus]
MKVCCNQKKAKQKTWCLAFLESASGKSHGRSQRQIRTVIHVRFSANLIEIQQRLPVQKTTQSEKTFVNIEEKAKTQFCSSVHSFNLYMDFLFERKNELKNNGFKKGFLLEQKSTESSSSSSSLIYKTIIAECQK